MDWIKISDKLPEDNREILVFVDAGYILQGELYEFGENIRIETCNIIDDVDNLIFKMNKHGEWIDIHNNEVYEITHWMYAKYPKDDK